MPNCIDSLLLRHVRPGLAQTAQTIHSAKLFWTDELLSRRVAERMQAGVEVYGVWDQLGAANVSSQDQMLCAAGAPIGIEDLPDKVHHKFAVIDVEGDDPAGPDVFADPKGLPRRRFVAR